MYMDGIKIYWQERKRMKTSIQTFRTYSQDILVMKKEKRKKTIGKKKN